jgi:hypothetical protein
VTASTWQYWDPLSTTSGWWSTADPIVGGIDVLPVCTQAHSCSWTELTSLYLNARVRPVVGQLAGIATAGRMWLKAGGGWVGGFDGNVDALTVGIDSADVTYDFEP